MENNDLNNISSKIRILDEINNVDPIYSMSVFTVYYSKSGVQDPNLYSHLKKEVNSSDVYALFELLGIL